MGSLDSWSSCMMLTIPIIRVYLQICAVTISHSNRFVKPILEKQTPVSIPFELPAKNPAFPRAHQKSLRVRHAPDTT